MSEAHVDRRSRDPGRRKEDTGRLWSLYLMIAIQAGGMVWFAATLSANVGELRQWRERQEVQNVEWRQQQEQQGAQFVAAVNALRSSVDVLNCRTGITCHPNNNP